MRTKKRLGVYAGSFDPLTIGHLFFLMPPRDIAGVSSSMVKGLVGPKGWHLVVRKYVPEPVYRRLVKAQP